MNEFNRVHQNHVPIASQTTYVIQFESLLRSCCTHPSEFQQQIARELAGRSEFDSEPDLSSFLRSSARHDVLLVPRDPTALCLSNSNGD